MIRQGRGAGQGDGLLRFARNDGRRSFDRSQRGGRLQGIVGVNVPVGPIAYPSVVVDCVRDRQATDRTGIPADFR